MIHTGVEWPGKPCGVDMGLETLGLGEGTITPLRLGDEIGLARALLLIMPFLVRTVGVNKDNDKYINKTSFRNSLKLHPNFL